MHTIGVLALQGCVDRHRPHLEAAGAAFVPVKTPEDFAKADAFIIPGGESTTMLKLIDVYELGDVLKKEFTQKPVWGICAGSILMAKTVTHPAQKSFRLMDITVERNGYGRQLESHNGEIDGYDVSFIRAPVVRKAGPAVEVMAEYENFPVWLKTGKYMVTTFHPELTLDYPSPMHREFVAMVDNFHASP